MNTADITETLGKEVLVFVGDLGKFYVYLLRNYLA